MIARRAGPLGLAAATAAVSVSAVLIVEARTDAGTVVWLRMTLAVVLLSPWAVPGLIRRRGTAGSTRDLVLTVAAGGCLAIHFLAWTASLADTSVAASVLLVSLHPLVVAPLGAMLFGDRLGPLVLMGILIALTGTVVTFAAAGGAEGTQVLRGDLLALAGGVALAGYLLIGRSRRHRGDVVAYSAVAFAVVAVAGGLTAGVAGHLHEVDGRAFLACLGLAAICTVGGHMVFNWALHRVPASMVSLSFLGEPPLAALLAFAVLGQRLTIPTLMGGGLILAGLAVTAAGLSASEPVRPGPR